MSEANPTSGPRHVLVTGGTSGIGLAIARQFAREGATVLATGLTADEVSAAQDQLTGDEPLAGEASPLDLAARRRLAFASLDVTDPAAIASLVGALEQLDVLVNCAGMIARGGREFDPTTFEQVIAVNLHGTMRMCRACEPLLADRRGAIVNIASMLSIFGSAYVPAYSASKGGVVQLTRSLAIAWAPRGIRVNAVAPGWIVTPLTQPLADDPARSAAIVDRTPLGRWGQPADVAGAVSFLCSPPAAFITGVVLPVDGGYSIA